MPTRIRECQSSCKSFSNLNGDSRPTKSPEPSKTVDTSRSSLSDEAMWSRDYGAPSVHAPAEEGIAVNVRYLGNRIGYASWPNAEERARPGG